MLSQTPEQNAKASADIEYYLTIVLHDTLAYFISKFGATIESRLGLTKEDILNDMRLQIWKGVISHNKSKPANMKTYLNTLIKKRFSTLARMCRMRKHNSLEYYADVYTSSGVSEEHIITEETGETLLERRQMIMEHQTCLKDKDRLVYEGLLLGKSIGEMAKGYNLQVFEVISIIKRIDEMVRSMQRG